MLAPCGIDCSACGTGAGGGCAGCRGDRTRQWSEDCNIRACCTDEKHLAYCSQCDQFACQKLRDWAAAWPHHADALKQLEGMRQTG